MAKHNGKTPTPDDQRANVKNPTSHEKKAADDNRSNQMNPEHPAHPSQQQGKQG